MSNFVLIDSHQHPKLAQYKTHMATNPQLDLAWKFLELTGTNIFLTGRAGTGKTTFLRDLKQRSPKRMIVVAPTGVAAINAGGVTIHSFFQIPFGPYLPAMQGTDGGRLKMNFNREKIAIIRSLDLLVIDEISMVRADLLDAINDVLQRYRDRNKPFGGVQMLMIGDLQQLAPVVKGEEWDLIHQHYASPYFFDSKALKSTDYISLELRHIYRQSDAEFIDCLNRVRDNNVDSKTLEKLNSRYISNFDTQQNQGYITLTSHNNTARQINDQNLDQLTTLAYSFACKVEGNFPDYLYPNDSLLTLKKGAQVMFVKNDTSGQHRYFNGKIGKVTDINQSRIEVSLDDLSEPIEVEMGEWTNAKYSINPQTKEIEEQIEGVFRQFPLKAAWAITIHKSQGLTFDKALIDASESFSHGQVYVALSRCRSFEGIVLRNPLFFHSIINDRTINAYNKNVELNQPNEQVLSTQSRLYYQSLLIDMFNFSPLRTRLRWLQKVFVEHLDKLYPKLVVKWDQTNEIFDGEIFEVSEKFKKQIISIIASTPELANNQLLTERIIKAQNYFLVKCEQIIVPMVTQSAVMVDNKETKKLLSDALKRLREVLCVKLAVLAIDNKAGFSIHSYIDTRAKASIDEQKPKPAKGEKTEKISVNLNVSDITNPQLFTQLVKWRKQTAESHKLPLYCIAHQKVLIAICHTAPRNSAELQKIKGVGKTFITKYGEQILAIIHHHNSDQAQ